MRFIGKDEKSGNWKNYVYPSYSVSNTPSSQYLGCCLLRSKWIERAMSNNYIGFPWISYSYSNSSGSKTFFNTSSWGTEFFTACLIAGLPYYFPKPLELFIEYAAFAVITVGALCIPYF